MHLITTPYYTNSPLRQCGIVSPRRAQSTYAPLKIIDLDWSGIFIIGFLTEPVTSRGYFDVEF